jgi:hypothetical protein
MECGHNWSSVDDLAIRPAKCVDERSCPNMLFVRVVDEP